MNELVKDGKINLGFANGWDSKWGNIYKQLREMEIPGTHETRERGRCWYEYSFDVKINEQIVKVVYSEDSGD